MLLVCAVVGVLAWNDAVAQGVPAPCQSITLEIERIEANLDSLQEELKDAAPGQKPYIGSRIRLLNAKIDAQEKRLAQCICAQPDHVERCRLRALLNQAFDGGSFGTREWRGFLVKEVGGKTLAEMNADKPFQPFSVLKLLPYLHALIEIDQGKETLTGTRVSWIEATRDNPTTSGDERLLASCLTPGAADTRTGSASLADALPTMMWFSHNRTLDSLLDRYGPSNITSRMRALGLKHTEMHFGCPRPGDRVPWAKNRSTLQDLGRLFEGVERLEFVGKTSTRDAFLANMININFSGATYTSPITGGSARLKNGFLREIVSREAGPAKQAIVDEFLKSVVLRGKGGGGGPSNTEFGMADFLHVTLPFKKDGKVVPRTFVVGWFINSLRIPPGCDESKSRDGGPCEALWKPERTELERFKRELHALPIRMALQSWP